MRLAGPGELRALARPLLVASVVAVRLFGGACLAWPLASVLAGSGIGARHGGDRALFESGGYLLVEVLRLKGSDLLAVAHGLLPMLGVGLLLNALCSLLLLIGLNHVGRWDWAECALRLRATLPRFVLFGAGVTLVQLAFGAFGVALAGGVPEALAKPVATSLGQAAVWLVTALVLAALGGLGDVSRAAMVRHEVRILAALGQALEIARRRPLQSCFGWLPYAALLLLAAALVGRLTELCNVALPGAFRVLLVFAAHQLVVVTSVVGRAAWYARALRLAATLRG